MIRYCIIGTGFSGTCMMWHLVNIICRSVNAEYQDLSHIEIVTIEGKAINGVGLPYDMDDIQPYHRCNNPAEKMSLFDNDFVDWMITNREFIISHYPELITETNPNIKLNHWQPDALEFYPRALFGVYLSMRFKEACNLARSHGIIIRNYNEHEAKRGITKNNRFNLTIKCLKSNESIVLEPFDKVLLATGHWNIKHSPSSNILSSPYPTQEVYKSILRYQQKHHQKKLIFYIHGMGPSGVDAILSLCEYGQFNYDSNGLAIEYKPNWSEFHASYVQIVIGSRSGLFPGVRWPLIDYTFQYLTEYNLDNIKKQNGGFIHLESLLNLIDSELQAASNNDLCLEDILKPKFKTAKEKLSTDILGSLPERIAYTIILQARRLKFYQSLMAEDKKTYDKELDSHFIRTAVPIPIHNAKKLIALMDADILSTIELGYNNVAQPLDMFCNDSIIDYNIMICSNGQNYDLKTHPSLFIKNLLEDQEVVEYSENGYLAGGICAHEHNNYQVINNIKGYKSYSQVLYSFGPITQYWQNQNNYAAAFVNAAKLVSQDWVNYMLMGSSHGL